MDVWSNNEREINREWSIKALGHMHESCWSSPNFVPQKSRTSNHRTKTKNKKNKQKHPHALPPLNPMSSTHHARASSLDTYLQNLNHEQRRAVTTHEDQCCIIAGPGTGKTSVISGRITYLIERMGVAPDRIMALTFSVKAAEEMRERANRMCTEAKHCRICTFHSACHRILGQQRQHERSYSLVSASEQDRIIGQAKNAFFSSGNSQGNGNDGGAAAAGGDDGESAMFKNRDLLGAISNCKNNGDLEFEGIKHREVKQLAQLYQRSLRESDLIDFDDLLVETKLLFERDDDKRRQIASGIEYLLVDEFQDTNLVQYDIAKYL